MSAKAHYERFVMESETKDPSILMKNFSPDVQILVKGQPKGQGINKLTEVFKGLWAKGDCQPKVLEIRELSGQDAVMIKAVDEESDRVVTTTYKYADVNGQKMIILMDTDHEI